MEDCKKIMEDCLYGLYLLIFTILNIKTDTFLATTVSHNCFIIYKDKILLGLLTDL